MPYNRRLDAKRDANEPEIVDALEAIGCDVLRSGDIDLIVGYRGRNLLIEVKMPGEDKDRKLKPIQKRLKASWKGQYAIVTTAEQALKAVGATA